MGEQAAVIFQKKEAVADNFPIRDVLEKLSAQLEAKSVSDAQMVRSLEKSMKELTKSVNELNTTLKSKSARGRSW
jgi:hypothetical protein